MRRSIILIIHLIAICFLSTANALQVKSAKDNETVFFKISEKEYSRIFVTSDRIVSVKGRNSLYEIKEFKGKQDDGVLYIKPMAFYPKKPFSIFITTEQGHHFTLFLASMDVPAENIEIKPITASKMIAEKWETNLPYTQSMMVLMRDMANAHQPEGYAVINLRKPKPIKIKDKLTMRLVTVYRGGFLEGEIWRLKNETGHTLHLHPHEFYQHKVRAVSIANETLKNCDETIVYRIVSDE